MRGPGTAALPGSLGLGTPPTVPLALSQYNDDEDIMEFVPEPVVEPEEPEEEPEDTFKNPSKVVLLKVIWNLESNLSFNIANLS